MEKVDLYDEDMRPLGKQVKRSAMRDQRDFFFIVHVWIRNKKGQYLIQKRNKVGDFKDQLWATTMGVVSAGETSLEAARKEVKEELGLVVEEECFLHIARYKTKSDYANHFSDIYVVEQEIDLDHLSLQESEVKEVKFVSKEQLYAMIKTKEFWDYRTLLHVGEYFTDLEKSE